MSLVPLSPEKNSSIDQERGNTTMGPDFLCIGMPASGTRWLYDSLNSHHDVTMPLIKELHFLDRGMRERTVKNRLRIMQERKAKNRPVDPCHEAFLDRYTPGNLPDGIPQAEKSYIEDYKSGKISSPAFVPKAQHFDWYLSLFTPYKPKMTGDITPGYWRVRKETIAAFHSRFPSVKYFAVVRNPVSRIVSCLNKYVFKGLVSVDEANQIIENPANFAVHTNAHTALQSALMPSESIRKWADVVGRDSIKCIILDDISLHPDRAREEVFSFLGLSTDPERFDPLKKENRKQGRFPKVLDDADTSKLRAYYEQEIKECKRLFGGATLNW
jgi:hypothetical protein